MVKETPICPVCGMPLRATGVNPDMYYCMKRKIWEPSLGMYLDVVDASVYVDANGKETLRVIEVPPFSFTITDDGRKQETIIRKVVAPERDDQMRKLYSSKARTFERKILLTIPAVAKMPWNDRAKVAERVKLYLLFS